VSFSQTRARITLILELRWPAQKPRIVLIELQNNNKNIISNRLRANRVYDVVPSVLFLRCIFVGTRETCKAKRMVEENDYGAQGIVALGI